MTFIETVEILSKIFDKRYNLFHMQYKCLNIIKKVDDDFATYAGMVNAYCEAFKLKELSSDMFKCLISVQGLTALKYKEITSRILIFMGQDLNIALQKVTEECQQLINIKKDNNQIEEKSISLVQTVRQQKWIKIKKKLICSSCRGQNIKKDGFFKDKICFCCGHVLHRSSHSQSKQKKETKRKSQTNVNIVLSKNEIEEGQRRKYLNVKINGQAIKLLLDSGNK